MLTLAAGVQGRAGQRTGSPGLSWFPPPLFIQSLTGAPKRPRESSLSWESGSRGECHASLSVPWTPESGDRPGQQCGLLGPLTQWLGQKSRRCLALGRGCSSQRRQEPGGLAGARCRLLSQVQGLPPWTQRHAWGICTIEELLPAFPFSFHPAVLFCGVGSSQVSGKCVPETQSELAACSPGRDCTGQGAVWNLIDFVLLRGK